MCLTEADFAEWDNIHKLSVSSHIPEKEIAKRRTEYNKSVNSHGCDIISECSSTQLRILNGQPSND